MQGGRQGELLLCCGGAPAPFLACTSGTPGPSALPTTSGEPAFSMSPLLHSNCNICLYSSFASHHPSFHSPALTPPPSPPLHPLLGLCRQDAQQQQRGCIIIAVVQANKGSLLPHCLASFGPPRSSHSPAMRSALIRTRALLPSDLLLPEIHYVSLWCCAHAVAL